MGELFGIYTVVLVLTAVDGFDVECVRQHEGEARLMASVSQPIPAEHALAANREAVLVRFDELEEEAEVIVSDIGVNQLLALAIHNADVHLPRV